MKYVVFEGPDGAGKTAVMHHVVAALRNAGTRVAVTREPGGDDFGEFMRKTLLTDRRVRTVAPMTQALLFAANSYHNTSVLPDCDMLLSDRWAPVSSRVYQWTNADADERAAIDRFWSHHVAGLRPDRAPKLPDLIVYLHLPMQIAWERLGARDAVADNMDSRRYEQAQSRHLVYAAMFENGVYGIPVASVDATLSVQEVAASVVAAVDGALGRVINL